MIWVEQGASNSARQREDQHDQQDEPYPAARVVAPARTVRPCWQRTNQQQNKYDDQDRGHRGPLLSVLTPKSLARAPERQRACNRFSSSIGQYARGSRPRSRPTIAEIANKMIATKKTIFASSIETMARPPKPRNAAISAMRRKVTAQPSMGFSRIECFAGKRAFGNLVPHSGFLVRGAALLFVPIETEMPRRESINRPRFRRHAWFRRRASGACSCGRGRSANR